MVFVFVFVLTFVSVETSDEFEGSVVDIVPTLPRF